MRHEKENAKKAKKAAKKAKKAAKKNAVDMVRMIRDIITVNDAKGCFFNVFFYIKKTFSPFFSNLLTTC